MTTIKEYKTMIDGASEGPWVIVRPNGNTTHIIRKGLDICRVKKPLHCWEEMENNAEFIAASRNIAPELIRVMELLGEALQYCADWYQGGDAVTEALSEYRKLRGY